MPNAASTGATLCQSSAQSCVPSPMPAAGPSWAPWKGGAYCSLLHCTKQAALPSTKCISLAVMQWCVWLLRPACAYDQMSASAASAHVQMTAQPRARYCAERKSLVACLWHTQSADINPWLQHGAVPCTCPACTQHRVPPELMMRMPMLSLDQGSRRCLERGPAIESKDVGHRGLDCCYRVHQTLLQQGLLIGYDATYFAFLNYQRQPASRVGPEIANARLGLKFPFPV